MKFEFTSLCSAGLLIKAGNVKLLCDALSRDEQRFYIDTPNETARALINAEPPFDGVSAYLLTHTHSDHFYPPYVKAYAASNKSVPFLMGNDARLLLESAAAPVCDGYMYDSGELRITAFKTLHQGGRYAAVEHYSYKIELYGKTLLVMGDAAPNEANLNAAGGADVLIAPFPYAGLPSARGLVKRIVSPRQIIALHCPPPERDAENWVNAALRQCETAKDGLPDTVFLRSALQRAELEL